MFRNHNFRTKTRVKKRRTYSCSRFLCFPPSSIRVRSASLPPKFSLNNQKCFGWKPKTPVPETVDYKTKITTWPAPAPGPTPDLSSTDRVLNVPTDLPRVNSSPRHPGVVVVSGAYDPGYANNCPPPQQLLISNADHVTNSPYQNGTHEHLKKRNHKSTRKQQLDGHQSFLRAARSGNVAKVTELLNWNIDINLTNSNGLTALHLASKENQIDVVRELLRRGASVHMVTKKGNTALHIASLAGHTEIVKMLIEHGANVNAQSQNGFTPLYMAAQENHVDIVTLLLNNSANPALSTEDGFTPLAVALQQGHDRVVALLLERDSRGKTRLPALHIAAKKNDVHSAALLLNNTEVNVDHASASGFTPLHIAAHYGNVEIAKLLIERGANINYNAKNSITPLHVAAKWGKNDFVKELIRAGADIDSRTRDGLTPLHCASRSGHTDVVQTLLKVGADATLKTRNDLTPLHMAAQGDHEAVARMLLSTGVNPDAVTVDYLTPLHVAAHCGNVNAARALLESHCNVNARALNGFTALHIACKKARVKIVELLLKHGAIMEAATETGLTPLHVASFVGCNEAVKILLDHGANVDQTTLRNETPLHLVARNRQLEVAQTLVNYGASLAARTRDNQTPLHVAVRSRYMPMVELLLSSGADPELTTRDNYTPLHLATKEESEEIVEALLEHHAKVDAKTKKGFTPLHLAAKYGSLSLARMLLEKAHADPNAVGRSGFTPVHVAAYYNQSAVLELLADHGGDIKQTVKNGFTPLHLAAKRNYVDCVNALADRRADVDAKSKNGYTPLHLAAQDGQLEVVRLLIDTYKATPSVAAKDGLTPLHLAVQEDKTDVAECLLNAGAPINAATTEASFTPLHTAAYRGQLASVRLLLSRLPESDIPKAVNARTRMGSTPLHLAAQQGHLQVVLKLLQAGANPNARNRQGWTAAQLAYKQHYLNMFEALQKVTTDVTDWSNPSLTGAGSDGGEGDPNLVTGSMAFEKVEHMIDHVISDSEEEGEASSEIMPTPAPLRRPELVKLVEGGREDRWLRTASYDLICQQLEYMRTHIGETEETTIPSTPNINGTSGAIRPKSLLLTANQGRAEEAQQSNLLEAGLVERPTALLNGELEAAVLPVRDATTHVATPSPAALSMWEYDAENIQLTRKPIKAGFLISFLVDARGCLVEAQRRTDLRFFVPPNASAGPTRVICRVLRPEFTPTRPNMNDGDCLAARILEMGPFQMQFAVPILIEVPHIASLRGNEREILVLRSETGNSWKEHPMDASDQAVHDALGEAFERVEPSSSLRERRIHRILTYDFPQYFALISRFRQEINMIGADGGVMTSSVDPRVQAIFPPGALQKRIRVGLQAQPIPNEIITRIVGPRVSVSPVVSIEPRRRKFHKPITMTIPLPKPPPKAETEGFESEPSLRLLCSLSGGTNPAVWEDITGSTPLTWHKDSVSFTTTVSARLWLINCANPNAAVEFATRIYRESIVPPIVGHFSVFARQPMNLSSITTLTNGTTSEVPYSNETPSRMSRPTSELTQIRCLCLTDDKEDKTLECLERFALLASGGPVELLENRPYWIELSGNFTPMLKTNAQPRLVVRPFEDNRVTFPVRVHDAAERETDSSMASGRILFMRDPRHLAAEEMLPKRPVTELLIRLPRPGLSTLVSTRESEIIGRSELNRKALARQIGVDWRKLAPLLGFNFDEIEAISRAPSVNGAVGPAAESEKAEMLLGMWLQRSATAGLTEKDALGNQLADALTAINRSDAIHPSMFDIRPVVAQDELRAATAVLGRKPMLPRLEEVPAEQPPKSEEAAAIHLKEAEQPKAGAEAVEPVLAKPKPVESAREWQTELLEHLERTGAMLRPTEAAAAPAEQLLDGYAREVVVTHGRITPEQPSPHADKEARLIAAQELAESYSEVEEIPTPVAEKVEGISEIQIKPISGKTEIPSVPVTPETPMILPQTAKAGVETGVPLIIQGVREVEEVEPEQVAPIKATAETAVQLTVAEPVADWRSALLEHIKRTGGTLEPTAVVPPPKAEEFPPDGQAEEIIITRRPVGERPSKVQHVDTETVVSAAHQLVESYGQPTEAEIPVSPMKDEIPPVFEPLIQPVDRTAVKSPTEVTGEGEEEIEGVLPPYYQPGLQITAQQPEQYWSGDELRVSPTENVTDEEAFEEAYQKAAILEAEHKPDEQERLPVADREEAGGIPIPRFPLGSAGHDVTQSSPEESQSFEEVEEVLPDGTVVKSRTATTETVQSVSCRNWQDGIDAAIDSGAYTVEEPEETTNVEEVEETLPDGTVITRLITTKRIVDRVVEHAVSEEDHTFDHEELPPEMEEPSLAP
ncbi:unnamed protein product [Calicophoron daubneyi]|uniref:Ankyrin n=1 Tax=Calicophoron daubneyi TaxID=300641 RepID=A0AAV2T427_CALDB